MSPSCETCRFWGQRHPDRGDCQRHAPVASPRPRMDGLGVTVDTVWPQTWSNQWCGDYEARQPPREDHDS